MAVLSISCQIARSFISTFEQVAYESDANNSRMIGLMTFYHGVKNGESKTWPPGGSLISYYVYARNAIVEDKLHPLQAIANTCVESSCGKNNDAPWIEE